jgi:Mucin-2 protein WxxW repeating region/Ricin-type beta-trefoil lectin domain-like
MRRIAFWGFTALASVLALQSQAETLSQYVSTCRTQLNIPASQTISDMDCYNGDLFDAQDPAHDYLGHVKVTDQVDLTFACRWLGGDKSDRRTAVRLELMLHNRQNGNTCFFEAKQLPNQGIAVPSLITSPTSSQADSYWEQPSSVDANLQCVGCHVSGAYIATPKIAPFLAKDGLMNDGHDTLSNVTSMDLQNNSTAHVKYYVVGSTFNHWNTLKQTYINPSDSGCAMGCHLVGTSSPQTDVVINPAGTVLASPNSILTRVLDAGAMAPYDDSSAYRWLNLDSPGDGVETETFAAAKKPGSTLVPNLFNFQYDSGRPSASCGAGKVPSVMEAQAVDTGREFFMIQPGKFASLPDRLAAFNAKDGLVCLNSDQEPGTQCQDYKVRFECTDSNLNKTWTGWYNRDTPASDGDHEERPQSACASPLKPTGIEAAFTAANGWTYSTFGPNDRLAQNSQFGVICNASDQPDGQCANYTVRFTSCGDPVQYGFKYLTNVFTSKQLTSATGSLVKGQAHNSQWNTQQWSIENIANTEYVRLRLPNSNVYLNVTSQAESAVVGTAASSTATSEMWLVEHVSGSTDVRLKNLWTGKYLTMADPKNVPSTPDYLPIYSQGRNTSWTSQRWILQ